MAEDCLEVSTRGSHGRSPFLAKTHPVSPAAPLHNQEVPFPRNLIIIAGHQVPSQAAAECHSLALLAFALQQPGYLARIQASIPTGRIPPAIGTFNRKIRVLVDRHADFCQSFAASTAAGRLQGFDSLSPVLQNQPPGLLGSLPGQRIRLGRFPQILAMCRIAEGEIIVPVCRGRVKRTRNHRLGFQRLQRGTRRAFRRHGRRHGCFSVHGDHNLKMMSIRPDKQRATIPAFISLGKLQQEVCSSAVPAGDADVVSDNGITLVVYLQRIACPDEARELRSLKNNPRLPRLHGKRASCNWLHPYLSRLQQPEHAYAHISILGLRRKPYGHCRDRRDNQETPHDYSPSSTARIICPPTLAASAPGLP